MIFSRQVDTLCMMNCASFDKNLVRAYEKTRYEVPELDLAIKVGSTCPKLDHFLENTGKASWAFISAGNPRSSLLPAADNAHRHAELKQRCSSYRCYEGLGVPADGDWPAEQSLLVIGISRDSARTLGSHFQQNAIVFGTRGTPAELIFCEQAPADEKSPK